MKGRGPCADEVSEACHHLSTMHLTPRSQTALDLLTGPPPEVLDEVAAAWERAQEPLPDSLELCFASEPALGRAWVRIIDVALLFILLALGLNIVVGFAGLLDLAEKGRLGRNEPIIFLHTGGLPALFAFER